MLTDDRFILFPSKLKTRPGLARPGLFKNETCDARPTSRLPGTRRRARRRVSCADTAIGIDRVGPLADLEVKAEAR